MTIKSCRYLNNCTEIFKYKNTFNLYNTNYFHNWRKGVFFPQWFQISVSWPFLISNQIQSVSWIYAGADATANCQRPSTILSTDYITTSYTLISAGDRTQRVKLDTFPGPCHGTLPRFSSNSLPNKSCAYQIALSVSSESRFSQPIRENLRI